MTTISIIGSGNMATAIGTRAAKHGHTIEVLSRDPAKARSLADTIGNGATAGTFGDAPSGDIVVVAVPYTHIVETVKNYGDALTGKILVDISNTFNADATTATTASGTSAAQEIAAAAPEGARVVKALNTVFGHVLAGDTALDAFVAGDDAEAKAAVVDLLKSMGLRPIDTGGIQMATALEWAGVLLMGVAGNGAGFNVALGAEVL